MSYECHITTTTMFAPGVKKLLELPGLQGCKTSEIERDPILGDATYLYVTFHKSSLTDAQEMMRDIVSLMTLNNIPVIREKIELIIHDRRY
jgi:hypothetical protein